ncbi:MAG: molecular chaperone [Proteobacteria bacterium]|nr:molecular chaperone [Pseudomonadota bacterium]
MSLAKPIWVQRLTAVVAVTSLLVITSAFLSAPAVADLMITPKRVILSKGAYRATLHLLNDSNETRVYDLGWKQMRMDNTGKLIENTDPVAAGNASSLVVLNPKRVVLGPGESQAVKLRARLPAELPFGEYISHLSFAPVDVPVPEFEGSVEGAQTRIKVLLGIAIPVIVRHGDLTSSAEVQITGLDMERGFLNVDVSRQGTASIVGNLEGYWGLPGQPGTLIAQLNNVAVYANLSYVSQHIPFQLPENFQFQPGLLHVIYRNPSTLKIISQSTIKIE